MFWNISAECVSAVILCIIWVYSIKGNPLPTLQNKFFRLCFCITFFAIISNIVATILLYNINSVPLFLLWIVNILYFTLTPLMGVFYFNYVVTFISDDTQRTYKILALTFIPAAIYLVFVFTAPINGLIFSIDPVAGYTRGPLISLTYIIFYIYCFTCIFIVFFQGKRLDGSIKRILISFPIVAAIVILIQVQASEYILTGSAATCALLIIYLYLQNKQISLDYLTGLPNRQAFLKTLDFRLRHHRDASFTIMVLSLRGFRNINDKFGQQNGNSFLQEISSYLRTVTKSSYLYRYGGDEFAWILDYTDLEKIEPLRKQLCERMEAPWETKNCSALFSYVLGAAQYPYSTDKIEDLIDGIETAVATAKRDPNLDVCFCTPEMIAKSKRRNMIIEILKDRLANDSFIVYYQPILSIESQMLDKAEALLRLGDTPLGAVYPSEFIPIAEETGLIIDITYQVIKKVCKFVKELLDAGTNIQTISINFAAPQFTQRDIEQRVFDIIAQSGAPYENLKIEITESVLMEKYAIVKDFVDAIHARGIHFALDDFGTGYSNISTVLGFPIDAVKLDKSLVWSSSDNPKSKAIVRHMVAAFNELGIDTLAEGVENDEQRQFIEDCGCSMIQGFLYSKPLPKEEAAKILGTKAVNSSQ